jgi:glucan phosphoethanolaminetransferase (alkaline phosphatase superfamily)
MTGKWNEKRVTCTSKFTSLAKLMRTHDYHLLILFSKLGSLFILLALAPLAWWGTIVEDVDLMLWGENWTGVTSYLTATAISLSGLCVLPFLRSNWLRIPLAAVFLIGFGLDQVILSISGHHLTLDMAATLLRERDMAGGAFRTFSGAIIKSSILIVCLALVFFLPPHRRASLGSANAIIPVSAIIIVLAYPYNKIVKVESFPSPYSVPAQLLLSLSHSMAQEDVVRSQVTYNDVVRPKIKKIVMIVDEATRGDYFGLNNIAYDNTPFLKKEEGFLANYGVAVSASNCSHTSRYLMRIGLRRDQIPDSERVADRLPTVWQYAKAAGFKTVMIDAFRKFGSYHSYMNYREAEDIEEYFATLDHPYYKRDVSVAEKLLDVLKRDEPMLIYVNKFGTHQPYDDSFDPDLPYDPSHLVSNLPLTQDRKAAIRDYHKALRWSADTFFEKILPALGDDTLLVYTSDHGEALYDGAYDWGHCTSDHNVVVQGEALVPLFVATRASELQAVFRAEASRSFNRVSHFHIFPTILELMGYSQSWIESQYGPSLLQVPSDGRRAFLVGNIESKSAVWVDVDKSVPGLSIRHSQASGIP